MSHAYKTRLKALQDEKQKKISLYRPGQPTLYVSHDAINLDEEGISTTLQYQSAKNITVEEVLFISYESLCGVGFARDSQTTG